MLTESKYKIYHNQLVKKINKLSLQSRGNGNDNETEHSLLPLFPRNSILQLKQLDKLLDSSPDARKQFVS